MPVMSYADYERKLKGNDPNKKDKDCLSCPGCSSQFFEEVEANRYLASHSVIAGQKVPTKPGVLHYVLLRCLVCGDLFEPRLVNNVRDINGGDYGYFLDTMEGKFDTRSKENQTTSMRRVIDTEKL